jgi:hypothetical protein
MVFVLAWTTGDANNLSCPALNQAHFAYGSMSSGTTEKVAMQWPPWSFGFMPLPFVTLTSGASFVFMYVQSYFGN